MTDFLPHDIVPGTPADANEVQENFEAIENEVPWSNARLASGYLSSKITWDQDPPISQAGVESILTATSIAPGVLSGDPTLSAGLGLTPTPVGNSGGFGAAQGIGPIVPARYGAYTGFLWASASFDQVGFYAPKTVSSEDSGDDAHYEKIWQLGSGSVAHAVMGNGYIYAACDNSGAPRISRINLADDSEETIWVDLQTVEGTTFTAIRRAYLTRYGAYLILIAKKSGDSGFKWFIRVNTATGNAIAWTTIAGDGAGDNYSGNEDVWGCVVLQNSSLVRETMVYLMTRVDDAAIHDSYLGLVEFVSLPESQGATGASFAVGSGLHVEVIRYAKSDTFRYRTIIPMTADRFAIVGDEYPGFASDKMRVIVFRGRPLSVSSPMLHDTFIGPQSTQGSPDEGASQYHTLYTPGAYFDGCRPGTGVWTGNKLAWLVYDVATKRTGLLTYGLAGRYSFDRMTAAVGFYGEPEPASTPDDNKFGVAWDGRTIWYSSAGATWSLVNGTAGW